MAQRTQVILVDDVDGGEADETVTFAIDGVTYEIDVSQQNAESLREAFAPWVGHARRVGGRSSNRARATSAPASGPAAPKSSGSRSARGGGRENLSEVRAWARENGFQVSDRGRVSAEVMAAYEKAH